MVSAFVYRDYVYLGAAALKAFEGVSPKKAVKACPLSSDLKIGEPLFLVQYKTHEDDGILIRLCAARELDEGLVSDVRDGYVDRVHRLEFNGGRYVPAGL